MKTVLVVDDAAFMRLAVKTMLEKTGLRSSAKRRMGLLVSKNIKSSDPTLSRWTLQCLKCRESKRLNLLRLLTPSQKLS